MSLPLTVDMKYYIRILSVHYIISCAFLYFSTQIKFKKLDQKQPRPANINTSHSLLLKLIILTRDIYNCSL